jgi:hypothetical protein
MKNSDKKNLLLQPEDNITKQQNNKTIKQQNNKIQNIKHISGIESNTSQMTSSKPKLRSIRDAEKNDWVNDLYRCGAAKIKTGDIFYASASVKGYKSNSARREVNIDIVLQSGDRYPIHLKAFTVNKSLKWELFRELPDTEKTADCWEMVAGAFDQEPKGTMAGKLITRRKYPNIPKFRVSECSVITEQHNNFVIVHICLGANVISIQCNPIQNEWFMYRGDWKSDVEMEVV